MLPLQSEVHIVAGRQKVRALCQALQLSLVDQTKMITAASELSRNTLVHGGGGQMRWRFLQRNGKRGLQLLFEDHGPGIADLSQALKDGWSSGNGMGLGLPGSRRLVDEFEIRSVPGQETCVGITKWN